MSRESAMAAYFHLLKSIETVSDVDDKTKIKSAYTLFKVTCQKELTRTEKRIVEKEWEHWRNYSKRKEN
jgi:hypothetical protein